MWLLSKQLNITNRIRVNDTSGGNYFNLTTSTKNIEEAVESVFGKSASYLGAIAIESNTVKSYIEDKLYIRKERLSSNSTNLFINGKPYAISTLQTSFNSSTYYDKTKLLSAVKNLTPTISITKVETILYLTTEKIMLTLQETKQKLHLLRPALTMLLLEFRQIQKQSGFIILRRQVL